jgi:hypothetical protein
MQLTKQLQTDQEEMSRSGSNMDTVFGCLITSSYFDYVILLKFPVVFFSAFKQTNTKTLNSRPLQKLQIIILSSL